MKRMRQWRRKFIFFAKESLGLIPSREIREKQVRFLLGYARIRLEAARRSNDRSDKITCLVFAQRDIQDAIKIIIKGKL